MHPYLIVYLKKAIQQISLVLSCKQQTTALRSIHNVSNNSHHANKNTAVFPLVATAYPFPCTFLSLEPRKQGGMNPLSSIKLPLGDALIRLKRIYNF